MQLIRSLRTRARWALAWLVLVLAAGVLSPVLAAQRGDFLDSFCTTPTTSDRAGVSAPDTGAVPDHNVLKCPLCWSVSALPPAPSGAPDRLIEPERYTRSRLSPSLHALAPGFEPARGPPRA